LARHRCSKEGPTKSSKPSKVPIGETLATELLNSALNSVGVGVFLIEAGRRWAKEVLGK
jgi:hypothetical protein